MGALGHSEESELVGKFYLDALKERENGVVFLTLHVADYDVVLARLVASSSGGLVVDVCCD